MHIAFDARTNSARFPGIGRYTRNLQTALEHCLGVDDRLTVICGRREANDLSCCSLRTASSPFSLKQQWEIPAILRKAQADLYHSPYLSMPLRLSMPAVVTIHDLIPLRPEGGRNAGIRCLFALLLRAAVAHSDHIVVVSDSTRRDLLAYLNVGPSRVSVAPSAVDPCFSPQGLDRIRAIRKSLKLPDRYVLYVGGTAIHKNLLRLIKSWQLVCNTRASAGWALVLAGPLDARYARHSEFVQSWDVDRKVKSLGWVEDADLPALYAGAGLLVQPSLYEGFGLPVLEAMACGTPVACSRAASLPEVAGDAAVYFDPTDVEEMASVMLSLIDDEEQRRDRSTASLARSREFTWEQTCRKTLLAYKMALK